MHNTLEVNSIYKSVVSGFKLSDISLICETGDIIGIFGRNGSGKSLLLKTIFGTTDAENKFIKINKKIADKLYLVPKAVVHLPQQTFLPKHTTVHKIISLYFHKDHSDFTKDPILRNLLSLKVAELSAGELRYFELKLILLTEAKFALLDEPLSQLSPLIKEQALHLIKKASLQKGIILCDHDYFSLSTQITHTLLMHAGSLKKIRCETELKFWNYLP